MLSYMFYLLVTYKSIEDPKTKWSILAYVVIFGMKTRWSLPELIWS